MNDNNKSLQTASNSTKLCTSNKGNNISIKGKNKYLIRKNYYRKYYNNINNIYVVDYRNRNGYFCYRAIYIVPKGLIYRGGKYLGCKDEIKQISSKTN